MNTTSETKRCSSCKQTFPLSSFTKDKTRKDGLSCRCKSCKKESTRKYQTPEYTQKIRLKSRYGITPDDAANIKSNGCQLCGSFSKLCIDHNHKTGEVRGCLCHLCNVALGNYEALLDRFGSEVLEGYRNGLV